MSSGSIMIIFTTGFFILLGCGMLAILFFGIRAIINSNDRRADTIARGYASGQIVEAPGQAQGTWYARFVPDVGAVGALLPFSGVRELGLVRLAGGQLEFWRDGAQTPQWVAPVSDIRVRIADFAVGRLADYPLRFDSPQSGALLGEISLEPLNTFGELDLKDQRNHEYSRHFADLLIRAGATRIS